MTFITEAQIDTIVPETIARFNQLKPEDRLALIWFAFTEMGKTITIAAPGAASMIFAQGTLDRIQQMSPKEQTQVMFDLANRTDTPICRTYGSFTMNLKLGFWNQLGEWMAEGLVAPIPPDYQLSPGATAVLQAIENADSAQQITILRNTVVDMGYDMQHVENYQKVTDPIVMPTEVADRTLTEIEGMTDRTVLDYFNNMNANDFEAAVDLFTTDGALQPPFHKPIGGYEAILAYMREECQGLKMMPEQGAVEPLEEGHTPIKVTGKVQTPWFGNSVGMNIAWRFLLDPEGKIFFVSIDLLASPKELLNLIST